MGLILTTSECAKALGVNRRTPYEWLIGGCPSTTVDGTQAFDLETLVPWLVKRGTRSPVIEAETLRLRKLTAETIQSEAEAAIKTGDAVSVEDLEQRWCAILSAVRARFIQLPGTMAARVAHESDVNAVEAMLREAVEEGLRELSSSGEDVSDDTDSADQAS